MSRKVITVSRLASGKNVIRPPRPNPAPSASASRSALRISSAAMASRRSVGTSFIRVKSRPQAVLVCEMKPEIFRVDLDRTQPTENPKPQKAADGASRQRAFYRVV